MFLIMIPASFTHNKAESNNSQSLNLIDRLNCGKIACDEYDLVDKALEEKVIKTTISKVNGVLGIDVPKDTIVNILSSLSFKVKTDGDNLEVIVPLF